MTKSINSVWSILLIIFLIISLSIPAASIVNAESTFKKKEMIADSPTLDSYSNWLNKGTQYSGAVWNDKTVKTGPQTFITDGKGNSGGGLTISPKADNFLVDLSTMSETYSIKGYARVPMDTVFVLDLSSSMTSHNMEDKAGNIMTRAEAMVAAANDAIKTLLDSNPENRIGVVVYNGQDSNDESTAILSDLDTYASNDDHLAINMSSGILTGQSGNREFNSGTNIQLGIYEGIKMLTSSDPTVDINGETVYRSPSLVLLSDGAATYASGETKWWEPSENSIVGRGTSGSTNSEGLGYLAAMTAAYHKNSINSHYKTDEAKIYTIGVGLDFSGGKSSEGYAATVTLNPTSANLNDSDSSYAPLFKDHWNNYTTNKDFTIRVQNPDVIGQAIYDFTYSNPGGNILSEPTSLQYNDGYWPSDDIDALNDAFEEIVVEIEENSEQYPTDLDDDNDATQSGYIDIKDEIGEYMEVNSIHGVLTHNYYSTGSEMAYLLTKDSNELTGAEKKDLSSFYDFIVQRIPGSNGFDVDTAKGLLAEAVDYDQISYSSESSFSNYYAWYADADGNYLGFCPNPDMENILNNKTTDTKYSSVPAGAVTVVKSYAFRNADLKNEYRDNGDLMYLFVRSETDMNTGKQFMKMRVPASLIPLTKAYIFENEDGTTVDLSKSDIQIEKPLRLLYDVGVRSDITLDNLKSKLSDEYKSKNAVPGEKEGYYLYSNEWDRSKSIKAKTTSVFYPSTKNRFYYFNEATKLYTDKDGLNELTTAPVAGSKYYYEYVYFMYDTDSGGNITSIEKKSAYIEITAANEDGRNKIDVQNIKPNSGSYYIQQGTQRISSYANETLSKNTKTTVGNLTGSDDNAMLTE